MEKEHFIVSDFITSFDWYFAISKFRLKIWLEEPAEVKLIK